MRPPALVIGLALVVELAAACGRGDAGDGRRAPTGTVGDPVERCARVADVCRIDGARLGVCTQVADPAARADCAPGAPCLRCMAQH